ncbi:MAG: hypothetical protein K6F50_07495 [Kiritimatiellae bacterium]|nr:hypothetical protein [Kiritimatiellia bacterium]
METKTGTDGSWPLLALAAASAVFALAAISLTAGCATQDGTSRRQEAVALLSAAYDLGGKEAVSNRIERLVEDGKITRSQGDRLHTVAQIAFDEALERLEGEKDAACGGCANAAADGGCGNCKAE